MDVREALRQARAARSLTFSPSRPHGGLQVLSRLLPLAVRMRISDIPHSPDTLPTHQGHSPFIRDARTPQSCNPDPGTFQVALLCRHVVADL